MTHTMNVSELPLVEAETAATWNVGGAGGASRFKLWLVQLTILVATIVAWEVGSRIWDFEFYVSRPTEVLDELQEWHRDGDLVEAIWATMSAGLMGFVLGSAIGAIFGLTLGWMRGLGTVLEPFVFALYTLPKIALAPLFVLWFGIGTTPKIVLAGVLVFFLVFFTTFQGAKNADRSFLEMATLMGGSRIGIFRKVIVPASAVWIFAGLRIALPYSIIGAVVGEFIAATKGIGFEIKNATSLLNTSGVFAGLVVLMMLAWLVTRVLNVIERRLLHWNL